VRLFVSANYKKEGCRIHDRHPLYKRSKKLPELINQK